MVCYSDWPVRPMGKSRVHPLSVLIARTAKSCYATEAVHNYMFLLACLYYLFDRLHNGEFGILLLIAESLELDQIRFQALCVNYLVISFAVVETAQPSTKHSTRPNLGMNELITSDLRNVYRSLRLSKRSQKECQNES